MSPAIRTAAIRSAAATGGPADIAATVTPSRLTPELVLRLQADRDVACVSVLLTTRRGPSLHRDDAATLRRLVNEAAVRLAGEPLPRERARTLAATLDRLADAAAHLPPADGLALFVNGSAAHLVHLPVPVADRVVVDPMFATRDLVRALHRTPRHAVLVLSARQARLLDGIGDALHEAQTPLFPIMAEEFPRASAGTGRSDRGGRGGRAGPDDRNTGPDKHYLHRVDAALAVYLRAHPAPLVIVGEQRTTSAFRATSRNLDRLAGTLDANPGAAPLSELVPMVRPLIDDYLRSREQQALELLDRRVSRRRSVSGIEAAWHAARSERPELLAVEEGFLFPARLTSEGDYVSPATEVEHPDVVDDLVDELIETVLRRGGSVALVSDGALAAHGRVALTLRP